MRRQSTARLVARVSTHACALAYIRTQNFFSTSRKTRHVRARHIAWWVLVESGLSRNRVAIAFHRDHTTVMNGMRVVDESIAAKGWAYKALQLLLEFPSIGGEGELPYAGDAMVLDDRTRHGYELRRPAFRQSERSVGIHG